VPTPAALAEAIRQLSRRRLLIGIPQENDPRRGEPIGNASLAYIHNFGSPARNIPARPHAIPGIEKAMPAMEKHLRAAAAAALDGKVSEIDAALSRAGIIAVESIRDTVRAGVPPPLSQNTIDRRRTRTPGSTYRRKAQTPADAVPLIDTGAYLASWTYVIEKG
jgi:hypothetical protein